MNSEELLAFTSDKLLPAADNIITNSYKAYCKGYDIGVETKSDNTPATNADREAEKALRSMILNHYPHHGIQGAIIVIITGYFYLICSYQYIAAPCSSIYYTL